jgi:hypothetical protein
MVTLVLYLTGSPCWNLSDTIVITWTASYTSTQVLTNGVPQQRFPSAEPLQEPPTTGGPLPVRTFVPDTTFLNATYQPSENDYNSGFIYLYLRANNACGLVIDSLRLDFPDLIVPRRIYPGNGGGNDFFEIRGLPPHSKLQVFNRWGQLVLKADNYHNNGRQPSLTKTPITTSSTYTNPRKKPTTATCGLLKIKSNRNT